MLHAAQSKLAFRRGVLRGEVRPVHLRDEVGGGIGIADAVALHIAVHEAHQDAIVVEQRRHLRNVTGF